MIQFQNQKIKSLVLEAFGDQPDVNLKSLKKRQEMRLLTTQLRKNNISYRWGLPFKLLVEFQKGYAWTLVNLVSGWAVALKLPWSP